MSLQDQVERKRIALPSPEEAPAKRICGNEEPSNMSNGIIKFALDPINQYVTCILCSGYFRDPVTITECLHTFCKSCLVLAISRKNSKCPTCSVDLGPDPFKTTLSDRTLQELVDKVLLPNLCAQDTAQEREFYSSRGINLKPEHEEDFFIKEFPKDNEARRVFGFAKNLQTDEHVEFTLVPEVGSSMPKLLKPMIRTLGILQIVQLKKYLVVKLNMQQNDVSSFEILCRGKELGNKLSLTFVKRTIWLDSKSDLQLTYNCLKYVVRR